MRMLLPSPRFFCGNTAGESAPPLLPAEFEAVAATSSVRTLSVGGETLLLDELGPVVIHADGQLGRLSNWHEMAEAEQQQAQTFIATRNATRRAALLAKEAQ